MRTVLIVDDDADLREAVVHVIETADRQIVEAKDGRDALDYILAHGLPDLILLDMNMPVMNGREFARELRQRGLWCVPVVVYTAAHDAERSANEIGAAGVLSKPFELKALRSILDQYVPAPLLVE
jgi:CheY-like chemotaxis protein